MTISSWIMPVIAGAALSLGLVGTVTTYRELTAPPPVEGVGIYRGGPVVPGQLVMVEWSLRKHVDCVGQDARHWHGERGFYVRSATGQTGLPKTDSPRTFVIPTLIPDTAPAGELIMEVLGSYDCPEGELPFRLGPVVFQVVTAE